MFLKFNRNCILFMLKSYNLESVIQLQYTKIKHSKIQRKSRKRNGLWKLQSTQYQKTEQICFKNNKRKIRVSSIGDKSLSQNEFAFLSFFCIFSLLLYPNHHLEKLVLFLAHATNISGTPFHNKNL